MVIMDASMHEAEDAPAASPLDRDDVLSALGTRVRGIRQAQDLSQAEAARHAGVHQSEWSRIERGRVDPGLLALLGLQRALRVDTLEALLGDLPSQRLGRAEGESPSSP